MALNPIIKSLKPVKDKEWKIEVTMNVPAQSTFDLTFEGSENNKSIIHATVTSGYDSGDITKSLNFIRQSGDNAVQVVAINMLGDSEGFDEENYPSGGGHV